MKKSGVSRVRNKMVLVLVIANAMLFLASVVTKATNLMNLSVLLFLPIMALLIATNRCPHCGKYFRGVYWAKEAGTCQKCGMRHEHLRRPCRNDHAVFILPFHDLPPPELHCAS